jgi:hypothetical protein
MFRIPSRRSDEGSALLIAVMTVGVCISLALLGVGLAQTTTRASGVDRQRLLAINAAEAGVDASYTAIQTAGLAPPCSMSAANIKSGPDTASYNTTITYYDAAGGVLACPLGGTQPVRALVKSKSTTNTLGGGTTRGSRTFEALINLNPVNDNNLTKAIFADGSVSFNNKTTITGNNGPDADVYSNGDYSCANNENFAGSLYSQGTITLSNSCTVAGNMWAKNNIQTSSAWNGSVAGYGKSGRGTIALTQGPGTVSGNLYASGTIAAGTCPSKCFPNNSPGDPPFEPFPVLRGDNTSMASWQAGSTTVSPYTLYDDNNCGTIVSNIVNVYAKKGSNTVLRTTCAIPFSSSFNLSNNLAIYAYGGITTGKLTIGSNAVGTVRNLHFIVPYDAAAARPCSSPVLDTDKQFDITDDIDLFIYSPCDITYRNSSKHIGQIYGGSNVTIANQFTMQYRPVPVFGIDPASRPVKSYIPSVVYKRETT